MSRNATSYAAAPSGATGTAPGRAGYSTRPPSGPVTSHPPTSPGLPASASSRTWYPAVPARASSHARYPSAGFPPSSAFLSFFLSFLSPRPSTPATPSTTTPPTTMVDRSLACPSARRQEAHRQPASGQPAAPPVPLTTPSLS